MFEPRVDEILSLHLYPVKSMGAFDVDVLEFDEAGPRGDREWMLVDAEGQFLSQRQLPLLARLRPRLTSDILELEVSGSIFRIPREPSGHPISVRVWKSEVQADRVPVSGLHEALSDYVGKSCQLVQYGQLSRREVTKGGRPRGVQFRFADSSSLLLTSLASLEDLNRRLSTPIPMTRFRPNVVLRGGEPWQEDRWSHLRAGAFEIEVIAGCGRCVVINRDQTSGESPSMEPLRVLTEFRRFGNSVDFGRLALHRGPGELRIGQKVDLVYSP